MTDTPGILREPTDPSTLISSLAVEEVDSLIQSGVIQGGMLPKIRSCLKALEMGCKKCHIIDGRVPHSALLEIFSRRGIGTLIQRSDK